MRVQVAYAHIPSNTDSYRIAKLISILEISMILLSLSQKHYGEVKWPHLGKEKR